MPESTVTIVGNVTRDPELRYTSGGRGVASFGVAVNRRYQQNGEWQEQVSFLDVAAWGTLGEHVAASISKGTRVVVTGRLEQRSWDTQEGEKRSKVEIIADEIGPSLRWAKCEVEKVERTDGSSAPKHQSAGTSGGRSAPGYDEEPFHRPADITDV